MNDNCNNNNLSIIKGTTHFLLLNIYTDDNQLYTLQSDDKIILGVKARSSQSAYDIQKIVTKEDKQDDGYIISFNPNDTQNLECGRYYYDIGLQTANGDYYMIVEQSDFHICSAITHKE